VLCSSLLSTSSCSCPCSLVHYWMWFIPAVHMVFLPCSSAGLWLPTSYCFVLHGSFKKFCTLYVFSLKMDLFYKIHLQAFNVISIVLFHSGPMFGKVLYSCLDAFVVDASDYSGHLIRHLLNDSEAFPRSGFFNFGNKSKSGGLSPPDFDLFQRNHSVGNASEALRSCLMRWRE
jgi:hypothetical protein